MTYLSILTFFLTFVFITPNPTLDRSFFSYKTEFLFQDTVIEEDLLGGWELIYRSSNKYRSNPYPKYSHFYFFKDSNQLLIKSKTKKLNGSWKIRENNTLVLIEENIEKVYTIYYFDGEVLKLRNSHEYLTFIKTSPMTR